jgi:hypothetical protein
LHTLSSRAAISRQSGLLRALWGEFLFPARQANRGGMRIGYIMRTFLNFPLAMRRSTLQRFEWWLSGFGMHAALSLMP